MSDMTEQQTEEQITQDSGAAPDLSELLADEQVQTQLKDILRQPEWYKTLIEPEVSKGVTKGIETWKSNNANKFVEEAAAQKAAEILKEKGIEEPASETEAMRLHFENELAMRDRRDEVKDFLIQNQLTDFPQEITNRLIETKDPETTKHLFTEITNYIKKRETDAANTRFRQTNTSVPQPKSNAINIAETKKKIEELQAKGDTTSRATAFALQRQVNALESGS